ncbi:hypothetical protein BDD12DRAFT_886648 [Trichophaea hybrida]|nr:hypothetical protein BDD12DRAFT_886648 [Trichophaea hybrida]
MPSFLDHLHAYGRREKREQDASFGGGRYKLGFSASKVAEYELCYTLKFGVNNGRKEPMDPYAWSIRQTSVYQKFRYNERNSTWILVQPAESVQSRLMAAVSNKKEDDSMDSPIQSPLKTHLLFLSAVSEGWRDYFNHLEKIFYHTTKAAVNFSVQRSNERYNPQSPRYEGKRDPLEQFEVDFEDVQDLQRFEELLRRVKTSLEINEDSIRSLKALNDKLRDLAEEESSLASWSEVDIEAEQQLAIVARHKRNFDTLLKNVHGRAQLLFNVLDFRNALTVSFTGQRAVDISYLQTNERTMMTMIQEMSTRDAIGVKVLTLLATLYVPASFVATFMAAGIITFDEKRSNTKSIDFKRLALSRETMIFYISFTAMLMFITYGCWYLWVRKVDKAVAVKFALSRANSMPLEPEKGIARAMTGQSGRSGFSGPPMTPTLSPISPMSTHFIPTLSPRSTMTR